MARPERSKHTTATPLSRWQLSAARAEQLLTWCQTHRGMAHSSQRFTYIEKHQAATNIPYSFNRSSYAHYDGQEWDALRARMDAVNTALWHSVPVPY